MQLIRKFIVTCVIDIFSKYAWVVPLQDKEKDITIVNAFQKIIDNSKRKTNKI